VLSLLVLMVALVAYFSQAVILVVFLQLGGLTVAQDRSSLFLFLILFSSLKQESRRFDFDFLCLCLVTIFLTLVFGLF
jgi:hypothetical protein